ncbi:hypothetical protein [Cronobacter dublinensis]|uniref:MrpH family fimbial adhesin n=1 Tax=Cronobacter dublinensis TaxID=413497 RepID=UPI001375637C|nr:hypothetical protein [Cronobacter dublinensis]NCH97110.1 hypothetical protein [Cronobacter dublinensis]
MKNISTKKKLLLIVWKEVKILLAGYFFMACIMGYSYAGQYPVINSLQYEWNSDSYSMIYHITQGVKDIGSASEQYPPNGWIVCLAVSGKDTIQWEDTGTCVSDAMKVDRRMTLGEYALKVYNNGGSSISDINFRSGVTNTDNPCVAYVAAPNEIQFSWSSVINPAGCTAVPVPYEACKITTGDILLDHGTLSAKEAEGNSAKANINVQCNTALSMKFHLSNNQSFIDLQPSGSSQITLNDQPLGVKMDLLSGSNSLVIKDSLSGVTEAGVNSGSSVLVMEPY